MSDSSDYEILGVSSSEEEETVGALQRNIKSKHNSYERPKCLVQFADIRKNFIAEMCKITKKKFITELNKLENLIFDIDQNDKDNYIFYATQVLDDFKKIARIRKADLSNKIEEINAGKYGFTHSSFSKQIEDEFFEIEYVKVPIKVEDGIFTCKSCGSKKVFQYSRQMKSGDENTSVINICGNCSKTWVIN